MSDPTSTYLVKASSRFRFVFGVFVVTSVLLVCCIVLFSSESFISDPQSVTSEGQLITDRARALYFSFFVLDFIWPLSFLLIGLSIHHAYKNATKDPNNNRIEVLHFYVNKALREGEKLPLLVAGIALASDYFENILFLTFEFPLIEYVQPAKIFLFASFLVLFPFFQFFQGYILKFSYQLGLFLRSSYLSLIIILIMTFLLSKLDQGVALLADLCEQPGYLILVYLLILHLAHIISHYPLYFLPGKEFNKYYLLEKSKLVWLNTYFLRPKDSLPDWHQLKYPTFNILRRALGLLLYLGWTYVILSALLKFWNFEANPLILVVVLFFFVFQFYWLQEQQKIYWKVWKGRGQEKALQKVHSLKVRFVILAILSFVLLVLTALVASLVGWSEITLLMMLLTSLIHALFFALFKVSRTLFWHQDLQAGHRTQSFIGKLISGKTRFGWFPKISNNKYYLSSLVLISKLALLTIFFLNLSPPKYIKITAVAIIILYLTSYYDLLALIIKRIRLHNGVFDSAMQLKPSSFWTTYFPFGLLIILVFSLTVNGHYIENPLNELDLVEEQSKHRGIDDVQDYFDAFESDTPLLISADGGGVRASFWTMLVLNELDHKTNGEAFRNTLSYSGASGGGIGQTLYFAMHDKGLRDGKSQIIDRMGRYNFLSSDLTYWLGHDFLFSLFPLSHYNRSDALISNYLHLLYQDNQDDIRGLQYKTFRETWNRVSEQYQTVPLLIVNTAQSENGLRSVASPFSKAQTEHLFPGTINILDHPRGDSTLTFFEAAFTTNRFPFYAPAAKIPGKGHFLDGGYFDNSGLTSTFDILRAWNSKNEAGDNKLNDSSALKRPLPYLVTIHNDKFWYAYAFLRDSIGLDQNLSTKHRTPLTSVLGGAAGPSLVGMPMYGLDKLDGIGPLTRDGQAIRGHFDIYLPYLLSISDIEYVLGGAIKEKNKRIEIMKRLKRHNEGLQLFLSDRSKESANQGYIIDPPLGRYLPRTVVEYMKNSLNFGTVRNEIEEVKELLLLN